MMGRHFQADDVSTFLPSGHAGVFGDPVAHPVGHLAGHPGVCIDSGDVLHEGRHRTARLHHTLRYAATHTLGPSHVFGCPVIQILVYSLPVCHSGGTRQTPHHPHTDDTQAHFHLEKNITITVV